MKTEKLLFIQAMLKCPKNQKNSFGWYNYRSCEDILEAVKPLLGETKTTLTISDDIVEVGGRIYVKATATLKEAESGEVIEQNVAYARESEVKKWMDDSQITGASSSYARKYALNGLFLLDDVKDADATNTHGKDSEPVKKVSKYTDDKWNPMGWFDKAINNKEFMKKCVDEEDFIKKIKDKYTLDNILEWQLREAYKGVCVKPNEDISKDLPF